MIYPFFLIPDTPAQADVCWLQGTEDPCCRCFLRARKDRDGRKVQFGIHTRGLGHFNEMPEETEAGNVCTGF